MYLPDTIKNEFSGLIGWRQEYLPELPQIDDSLTESSTGRYYQDEHALLTLENLRAIAPDFDNMTYPAWDSGTNYVAGAVVTFSDVKYKAKRDNTGVQPDTSTDDWEEFDPFSAWLEQKTKAAILKAISTFWSRKMADKQAKNLLQSKALFEGAGRLSDTIANSNSLVGLELVPIRAKNVVVLLSKIGLQFKGDAGDVKLYLFHSSNPEPIKTITFARQASARVQWFDMNEVLPYVSDSIDAGGRWYLVYDQKELTAGVEAINKSRDWGADPCSTCNTSEFNSWKIWSKYLEVYPFRVASPEGALSELWDIADNVYTMTSNHGLNVQLTIKCDVTDALVTQKAAFQDLISLQVAIELLSEMAFNPRFRLSRKQQNMQNAVSQQSILYALDGDSGSFKKSGLVHRFDTVLKAVNTDFIHYDKVCFPCGGSGIRYRTT